jgi:hypothetical protein
LHRKAIGLVGIERVKIIVRIARIDDFESLLAEYTNSLVELHGLYG